MQRKDVCTKKKLNIVDSVILNCILPSEQDTRVFLMVFIVSDLYKNKFYDSNDDMSLSSYPEGSGDENAVTISSKLMLKE